MATTISLTERIRAMDDFRIVRFFDHFGKAVLNNTDLSMDEALSSVPDQMRALPGFEQVENLSPEKTDSYLSTEDSAQLARRVLLVISQDPTLVPILESELNNFSDDKLVVDVILSVGLIAIMILITATTEVKISNGKVTIKKGAASPELVHEVLTAFTSKVL